MADPFFKDLAFAALAQTARNPTSYFLQATPRNPILGYLSDLAASSYSPERTQQMQGVAKFMSAPAISETLDRLSYGEPLTTGAGGLGGTTRVRPEALEAAMTVAPMVGPALNLIRPAVKAGARALGPTAVSMGEGYLQRQGLMPGVVPETPMRILDTTGLPNRGRDLIQSKAESLANQLRENGFNVDLQHSGSLAGPSSYLKIFDPQTGRLFAKDVRISGHSKGPFNAQSVLNVASDQELNNVISSAINMREMGVSPLMKYITDLENKAQEFIADGMKPRNAYKKAREFLDNQSNGQPSNNIAKEAAAGKPVQQAMNEFEQSLINFMATPAK